MVSKFHIIVCVEESNVRVHLPLSNLKLIRVPSMILLGRLGELFKTEIV